MTTDIILTAEDDPVMEERILDVSLTSSQTLPIHNEQAVRHEQSKALEDGLYFLAAQRKMSIPGGGPDTWTATSVSAQGAVAREFFTNGLECKLTISVSGGAAGDYCTVTLTTDDDGTGTSVDIANQDSALIGDAHDVILTAGFGSGVKANHGANINWTLAFALNTSGATVYLWGYSFQPQGTEEITV